MPRVRQQVPGESQPGHHRHPYRPARAFSDPRVAHFPSPVGPRAAYLFPFSDQVLYPRTMGARTAVSRLALEPPMLARALAALARTGVARALAGERARHALARRHQPRPPRHEPRFALRVDAAHDGQSTHATLVGGAQADAAAAGAAGLVRALLKARSPNRAPGCPNRSSTRHVSSHASPDTG